MGVLEEGDAAAQFGGEKPQVRLATSNHKKSVAEIFFEHFDSFPKRMRLPEGVELPPEYEVSVQLQGSVEHHQFVKPLQAVLRSEDGQLVLDFYFEFIHTDNKLYRLCYEMSTESFAVYGVKVQQIRTVQTVGMLDKNGDFVPGMMKKGKGEVAAPSITAVERHYVKLEKIQLPSTGKRAFNAEVVQLEPRWFWSAFFEQGKPNVHFSELRLSLDWAMDFAKNIRFKLTPRRKHSSSEVEIDEEPDSDNDDESSKEAAQAA